MLLYPDMNEKFGGVLTSASFYFNLLAAMVSLLYESGIAGNTEEFQYRLYINPAKN